MSNEPYICGRKIDVADHPELILDEYAEGFYYVLHNARRIGLVVGSHRVYNAEVGQDTVGTFGSLKSAAIGVLEAQLS